MIKLQKDHPQSIHVYRMTSTCRLCSVACIFAHQTGGPGFQSCHKHSTSQLSAGSLEDRRRRNAFWLITAM